ncbi:NAD-dependent epimerase/dehydratase family protein [Actinospica durhamensis]|uniref:NAD-dependent epimerase/dehydratase family protein n=1 Tax=Actinospica durhamensis TaxID=1508375 RepID=A0A941IND8_9ACTN|nr:NAD-dependent epimerase/dehydratase family protein [Actinospica durhamensis]MBR7831912.1 NAD-dependent epimerase/dehydratase family protein [Actinospica durhamensis]
MRVVILSGTSFVGRAICAELVARGHELLVVHRGQTEPPDLAPATHLHADRASWPERRAEIAAFRPDAAVDVSALDGPGADSALRALPEGLRLVVLSSVNVYRAYESVRAGIHTDAVPLTEQSPLRTARHLDGPEWENLDLEARYLAAGATVLRLGAVYGEHDYQRRLEFVLRRVRARRARIPFGAGTFLFSRIYVGDVATAVAAALERTATADEGEVFNIVESATPSIRLLAEQVLAALGSTAELVTVPDDVLPPDLRITRAGSQALLADAAKAREHLDWRESDPAQALQRTIAWHLGNPPPADDDFAPDDAALRQAVRRQAVPR